jgi:hypothetical protein
MYDELTSAGCQRIVSEDAYMALAGTQLKAAVGFATMSRDLDPVIEDGKDRKGVLMLRIDHATEVDEVNAVLLGIIAGVLVAV